MGRKRRGGMQLVVCLVLTALAIQPVGPVESALDSLRVGNRFLLQMGRPLWGLGHSLAADDGHLAQWEREADESNFLEQWVRDQAVPHSMPLQPGGTVHAEAIGRPEGKLDSLLVRVWRSGIVRVGMPVTTGDHYVGLVERVLTRRSPQGVFDDVHVQLITSGNARVQAGVYAEGDWQRGSSFVVGGLLAPGDFQLGEEREVLAVHHPSTHSLSTGQVLVNEPLGQGRDLAWLANGFLLGHLQQAPRPDEHTRMDLFGVLPQVDFESGLYQVLIHTGIEGGLHDAGFAGETEEGGTRGRWIGAHRAPLVDGAPWREGFKLMMGGRAGLQVGAAVANGVRLMGRVSHAGPWHADVVGPGDRRFAVPAIALWQNSDAEHSTFVLGRIRSLGRDKQGRLRMHWPATLLAPGDQPARARLYTGSGDPGVPRGLLLGEAEIPIGPGPHILLVDPPEDSDVWLDLRVFTFEEVQD